MCSGQPGADPCCPAEGELGSQAASAAASGSMGMVLPEADVREDPSSETELQSLARPCGVCRVVIVSPADLGWGAASLSCKPVLTTGLKSLKPRPVDISCCFPAALLSDPSPSGLWFLFPSNGVWHSCAVLADAAAPSPAAWRLCCPALSGHQQRRRTFPAPWCLTSGFPASGKVLSAPSHLFWLRSSWCAVCGLGAN